VKINAVDQEEVKKLKVRTRDKQALEKKNLTLDQLATRFLAWSPPVLPNYIVEP